MNTLAPSALMNNNADTNWNETPEQRPATSGVYQTRNDRHQIWSKYFDANYGLWYMSWAELKENAASPTSRISGPDVARHVVTWAHCGAGIGRHRGRVHA